MPTSKLDQAVTQAVRGKLLTPERLATILQALVGRQAAKDGAVANRRAALDEEQRHRRQGQSGSRHCMPADRDRKSEWLCSQMAHPTGCELYSHL